MRPITFRSAFGLLLSLLATTPLHADDTKPGASQPRASSRAIPSTVPSEIAALCDIKEFLASQPSETRQQCAKLYRTLLGVTMELHRARESFRSKVNCLDLFPTVYFYVVVGEMENIRQEKYRYCVEKMELILAFYDAYAVNRSHWDSGLPVEKHWKSYFLSGEGGNKVLKGTHPIQKIPFFENSRPESTGFSLSLMLAIDAHVRYDLARAIRAVLSTTPPDRWTKLQAEYVAADSVFPLAQKKASEDIKTAAKNGNFVYQGVLSWSLYGWGEEKAAEVVQTWRNDAWKDAISGEGLRTGSSPQPKMDRTQLLLEGSRLSPEAPARPRQ